MESLHDTTWDVVICGTGIRQSLLALALSRTGKRILHIDRNRYYGGAEAAFSLDEASRWLENGKTTTSRFSSVYPIALYTASSSDQLAASRSYTLTLSPHILYSQSALLRQLVAARLHDQLEFQAVGPWWICQEVPTPGRSELQRHRHTVGEGESVQSDQHAIGVLQKVPGTREDVFADDTLPVRDKRSLMKFLRWVLAEPESEPSPAHDMSLSLTLTTSFGVAPRLHSPLLALSLSYHNAVAVTTRFTIPRIRRHLRSIGTFGPGFGAVLSKYGGLAEIAQVACRASAVGGAVYVLGRGLQAMDNAKESPPATSLHSEDELLLGLYEGEKVKSRFVVGCADDYPVGIIEESPADFSDATSTIHSINIISSELEHLFPLTSENGPKPAGVVVVANGNAHNSTSDQDRILKEVPTYMVIHSPDSGECPSGQCVIYVSTSCLPDDQDGQGHRRLNDAVSRLLSASPAADPAPIVLWSMFYLSKGRPAVDSPASASPPIYSSMSGRALIFPPPSADLALDDAILDSVREAWKRIVSENGDGDGVDEAKFMKPDDENNVDRVDI